MGVAVARVHLNVLEELLGFRDKCHVAQVMPPGMFDLMRQTVVMVLESPEFPPQAPGMMLPEVWPVYEMRASGPIFKGFEFVGERAELPPGFAQIPEAPGQMPARGRSALQVDPDGLGIEPDDGEEEEPNVV